MRDLVARAALGDPGPLEGLHRRRGPHALDGGLERALEDARGAARPRRVRPRHDRPAKGPPDDPQPHPALRVPPPRPARSSSALLADVASAAALELPDGALEAALRRGRGSARDALSALDQVAAAGTVEDDTDALGAVVRAVAAREPGSAMAAVDAAVRAGADPQQLAVELVERLRSGFLAVVAPGIEPSAPTRAAVEEEARELGTARVVRAMELVGAAIVAMREAPEPRITLEVALLRLAHPEADDSPAALAERLERLERRLAGTAPAPAAPAAAPPAAPPPPLASTAAPATTPPPPGPVSGGEGPRPALGAFRRPSSRRLRRPQRPPRRGAKPRRLQSRRLVRRPDASSPGASGAPPRAPRPRPLPPRAHRRRRPPRGRATRSARVRAVTSS